MFAVRGNQTLLLLQIVTAGKLMLQIGYLFDSTVVMVGVDWNLVHTRFIRTEAKVMPSMKVTSQMVRLRARRMRWPLLRRIAGWEDH